MEQRGHPETVIGQMRDELGSWILAEEIGLWTDEKERADAAREVIYQAIQIARGYKTVPSPYTVERELRKARLVQQRSVHGD